MATTDKPNRNTRPRPRSVDKGTSDSPTSASSWKKKTVGGTLFTVPSGNTALIRTPGMQAFIKQGIIPNALMPFIQEAMKKGEKPSDVDVSQLLDDPTRLNQIMDLADAVTVNCCIDPKVEAIPLDEDENQIPIGDSRRDDDTLYVDEVDFEDKMYIFNLAVGGTSDLEKFREGPQSSVDALSKQ